MTQDNLEEMSDSAFLRYLADNDYRIDIHMLNTGMRLQAIANRLESGATCLLCTRSVEQICSVCSGNMSSGSYK